MGKRNHWSLFLYKCSRKECNSQWRTLYDIFVPELNIDLGELWFQPVDLLKETSGERILSHRGLVAWRGLQDRATYHRWTTFRGAV